MAAVELRGCSNLLCTAGGYTWVTSLAMLFAGALVCTQVVQDVIDAYATRDADGSVKFPGAHGR